MQFLPVLIGGGLFSSLWRLLGWPGFLLGVALLVGWAWIVRKDWTRLNEPRREDSGISTRFGRVTGRRRSALSPEECLARLATVIDHDDRFRLDALSETSAQATRLGNSVTVSYPLELRVAPAGGGSEVQVESAPETSYAVLEEDTVRVVEDLLDVVGPAGGAV